LEFLEEFGQRHFESGQHMAAQRDVVVAYFGLSRRSIGFRSVMVWNIGKGKVFYFRPGHETFAIFKEKPVL